MIDIATVSYSDAHKWKETQTVIAELNCRVRQIFVPLRGKRKRKTRKKLYDAMQSSACLLTEQASFAEFAHGSSPYKLMHYYPMEAIFALTHNAACEQVALLADLQTNFLVYLVPLLGQKYRFITLYSKALREMQTYAEQMYDAYGLPLRVKQWGGADAVQERYLIRVTDTFTVLDKLKKQEFSDFEIDFLYPLSKYKTLPLRAVLKAVCDHGYTPDLFEKHSVKIVGEISK